MTTHLWQVLFPGVLVTILGVEAIILTIWPHPTDNKPIKVCAVLLAFGLATGEILILKKDRQETFNQHKADMQGILVHFSDLEKSNAALLKNIATNHWMRSPHNDLKDRTIDLSSEILQFLVNREVPPGYGQGGFGQDSYGGKPADTKDYDKDTVETYAKVFEPRVATICQQLKSRGLSDEQLNAEYGNPTNTYSIRDIAERLTKLAQQLPD